MKILKINTSKELTVKTYILLTLSLILLGCGSGSGGSDPSTYSSCKIETSRASSFEDRQADINQCWNATNGGYSSQNDALDWCENKITDYLESTYTISHTVSYSLESRSCS